MAADTYKMAFNADNTILSLYANSSDPAYDLLGYSEEVPYTFDHIKEYAEYIDTTLVDGYTFNFVLKLEEDTYLIDTDKQIVFNRGAINKLTPTIYVYKSFLRLGICSDDANKITSNGCSVIIIGAISYYGGIRSYSGSVEVYSSTLKALTYYAMSSLLICTGKIYNSSIEGGGFYGGSMVTFNVDVVNAPLALYYSKPVIDDVKFINCASVARIRTAITHDVYMYKASLIGCTYMISIYQKATNGAKAELVDCECDAWGASTGLPSTVGVTCYLYRINTVNIRVVGYEGASTDNVALTVRNGLGTIVYQALSDEDGVYDEFMLTVQEWRFTSEGKEFFDYNNFSFLLQKDGFNDVELSGIEVLAPLDMPIPFFAREVKIVNVYLASDISADVTTEVVASVEQSVEAQIEAVEITADVEITI